MIFTITLLTLYFYFFKKQRGFLCHNKKKSEYFFKKIRELFDCIWFTSKWICAKLQNDDLNIVFCKIKVANETYS